jgi:2-hydroxy-3-oxopropionate reductase
LAGAHELGVALPQTAGAAQLMHVCAANGMGDLDHSALVKALELMANHEVADRDRIGRHYLGNPP